MATSSYSTVFDRPADVVWEAVRDFNGLATWWSSAVSSSEIEQGRSGDAVGAVRRFVVGGGMIRERLVALSDVERSYTYEFCDPAPFPVRDYRATLRVTPIVDGNRALVEWWTTFDCDPSEIDHWAGHFAAEVFRPALEGLRDYLRG